MIALPDQVREHAEHALAIAPHHELARTACR